MWDGAQWGKKKKQQNPTEVESGQIEERKRAYRFKMA